MADDWDPFGCDESEAQPESAEKPAAPSGPARISKEELAVLADHVYAHVWAMTPWNKAPNPGPDAEWYEPTCSFESWTHTDVQIESGQGILYVKICRPDANNMISDGVVAGLLDAVMGLLQRKLEYRMAVFSAEGKMFCGGRDPGSRGGGFTKNPKAHILHNWGEYAKRGQRAGAFLDGEGVDMNRLLRAKLWHTLSSLPQFTVCLVNGSVIGEGLALPACCDATLAIETAFFNCSDVQIGQCPTLILPYIVAKMGTGLAKPFFIMADNMSAEKACFAGLVSSVVTSIEDGHALITELAAVLTACGPRSVEAAKNLVTGVGGQQISEDIMFYTAKMLAAVTISDEARDGMIGVQTRMPKPWEQPDTKIVTLYGNDLADARK